MKSHRDHRLGVQGGTGFQILDVPGCGFSRVSGSRIAWRDVRGARKKYSRRIPGATSARGENRSRLEFRRRAVGGGDWSGRRDSNPRHPAWKARALPLSYSRSSHSRGMVEGEGFEPSKATPTDLQSVPFGHSGTPPFHLFSTAYASPSDRWRRAGLPIANGPRHRRVVQRRGAPRFHDTADGGDAGATAISLGSGRIKSSKQELAKGLEPPTT